ncbi:MAG: integration host factor subunit beta [Desulfamplus sp.]|nr:integration host factor subunit beta [Desulfamplus sp.]
MNKLELIATLKEKSKLTKYEAAEVVNTFFEALSVAMARGDRVEIRGLCSFYVKQYDSYTGRNPKSGKFVTVSSKKLPVFRCGKELKERVDKVIYGQG